jgi:hypothetical protein
MTADMTAIIPGQLRNYANGRVHWRVEADYRKQWRTVVALTTRAWAAAARPEALKHVHLEAWTYHRFDDDGLRNACKPIVDGLVDAGVLHSDGPDSGHVLSYSQAIKRKDRGIRITIEALP